ncbi:hypothetical protein M1349_02125, partial [Patescibacteria group bacterium]|nr:hypothetical protein [Patescibacteria group bacterium]
MERRFASPQYLYSHFRKQLSNQEVEVVLTRKISGKECLLGRVEPHVDQVKVKKNQSSEGKVITLIHELLHLKYPRGQDGEIEEHAL